MDSNEQYQYQVYYQYRAKELHARADRERLALSVTSGQRHMRFYYPVMASFGRWLMASGTHLQKRYGDLCDVPLSAKPTQKHA